MKVLYIGHYREESGWGRLAREYIKSLLTVGVEVVCRAVIFGNKAVLPDWLIECENRTDKDCDVCIQHTLPNFYVYSGLFKKTIGIVSTETDSLGQSNWGEYINLLDEVIVSCEDSKRCLEKSKVNIPIHIVGAATNIEKYKIPREKLNLGPEFKFLGVGEWTQRKQWGALIRAMHTEFDPSENVSLVLKVNSSTMTENELAMDVNNTINKIKTDMRLYKNVNDYKADIIITEFFSEEDLMKLYNSCDCYVSTSAGEAINYGCLDAIGFGMYPVVTNTGGMKEMVQAMWTGEKVVSLSNPVTGLTSGVEGLYTAAESWQSVSITGFGKKMRLAYKKLSDKRNKQQIKVGSDVSIRDYSYQSVGKQLLSILEN